MAGPFSMLDGHEQVLFGADEDTGLRCIIALHSTVLGPGVGGTRCHDYASEEEALADVLRLSQAMTLKAAVAGLDAGGGKAVIWGDPTTAKSEAALRAYGRMIDSLGGRYVTACDVGTTPADMGVIKRETRWVTGAEPEEGGSGDSGVTTAVGTYAGLRACAAALPGGPDLGSLHVAIEGVGKVGRRLAERLAADGAKLTVADVDDERAGWCAEHLGADVVDPGDVHAVDCDVLSPNALSATVSEATLPALSCRVVGGAANNQLASPELAEALADAGILYAPDFVINAGGVIQVVDELHPAGYSQARATRLAEDIEWRLAEVFRVAREEGITTLTAAERIAQRRIDAVAGVARIRRPAGR